MYKGPIDIDTGVGIDCGSVGGGAGESNGEKLGQL